MNDDEQRRRPTDQHVVVDLGDGRKLEAWIPGDADAVDLQNFIDHLRTFVRGKPS